VRTGAPDGGEQALEGREPGIRVARERAPRSNRGAPPSGPGAPRSDGASSHRMPSVQVRGLQRGASRGATHRLGPAPWRRDGRSTSRELEPAGAGWAADRRDESGWKSFIASRTAVSSPPAQRTLPHAPPVPEGVGLREPATGLRDASRAPGSTRCLRWAPAPHERVQRDGLARAFTAARCAPWRAVRGRPRARARGTRQSRAGPAPALAPHSCAWRESPPIGCVGPAQIANRVVRSPPRAGPVP
jgi:hypothetical protein